MGAEPEQLQVTVAATENLLGIFQLPDGGPEHGSTWHELPKTTILANPAESLRAVLRRAAAELGVTLTPDVKRIHAQLCAERGEAPRELDTVDRIAFAEFRQLDDDDPVDERGTLKRMARLKSTAVAVVRDDRGRAIWKRPPFEASMAELIDAADAGLLDGDPLQPYLVLVIPQGELGTLVEWNHFLEQLKLLWEIAGYMAQAGGAWGFIELVRRVARRRSTEATQAVEKNSVAWSERGAKPGDLVELIKRRPRSSENIAALLGCSIGEAEAILWALGCSQEGEVWVYRGDPASVFIADDLQLESMVSAYRGQEKVRAEFERRLEELGKKGSAPSAEDEKREIHEEFTKGIEAEIAEELGEDPDSS